LELGCYAGRNLDFLFRAGFQRLSAIEISERHAEHLRATYPELMGIEVTVSAVEDAITQIPDNTFNVVFAVAVLDHVHFISD
jgi:SAM-dependent methyltransferase